MTGNEPSTKFDLRNRRCITPESVVIIDFFAKKQGIEKMLRRH
jgi:hypothetical protein